jgi:hypothetical protein
MMGGRGRVPFSVPSRRVAQARRQDSVSAREADQVDAGDLRRRQAQRQGPPKTAPHSPAVGIVLE